MNKKLIFSLLSVAVFSIAGFYLISHRAHAEGPDHDHEESESAEAPRGPHNGRIFAKDDFAVELAIFEQGGPPEFRAWFSAKGKALAANDVKLTVKLTRANGVVDTHTFAPAGEFARSAAEVYEPHSFHYAVTAEHAGRVYQWELDAPEMQTTIDANAAARSGVVTAIAGPAQMHATVSVYGQIEVSADRVARATARFAGLVREMKKQLGDAVTAGEVVAVIESNETLSSFEVKAPRAGTITARASHEGETVSEGTALYTITDFSEVWVTLQIPRAERARVQIGQTVAVHASADEVASGKITLIAPSGTESSQTLAARVVLPNVDGSWRPGTFVKADIVSDTVEVPVAVKISAVQTLQGFTVVFSQHGTVYQARPLELGRRSGEWVEVLKGLAAGEAYVVENSFLLKADIGKSGASHDH